jgi:hypothetical protein
MDWTTLFILPRFFGALALAAVPAAHSSAPGDGDPFARIGWLAGAWVQELADGRREEFWLEPLGKTMLGVSRTVLGGRTVEYEYLRIEARAGTLVYIASPPGQAAAEFTAVELSDSIAVFADPAPDFPQRIRYRRLGPDAVLAQIEGERDGETRVIDFPFRRRTAD